MEGKVTREAKVYISLTTTFQKSTYQTDFIGIYFKCINKALKYW